MYRYLITNSCRYKGDLFITRKNNRRKPTNRSVISGTVDEKQTIGFPGNILGFILICFLLLETPEFTGMLSV